jgi:hypothetical protein
MTGDLEFIRESWPSLLKAYEWCLTTDTDGDGLMDNSRAGLGALEFGSLTGIQTDIYLAAVWTRACLAMEKMADDVGDREVQRKSGDIGRAAARSFTEKFWDGKRKRYSYAFNKGGELIPELIPWSAVGIAWGLGIPERSIETLIQMNSSDLTTDWGVRMLSDKSPLYEPLNYNYGAAWPFLTGWVSAALYRHNFIHQGYHALLSNVNHTFDNALGVIPELYSGHQNIWPQEGVPHQGFSSSGSVYPLVRGMLGLEGDAVEKRLVFSPRLPADWRDVSISNFRIGDASFAVDYRREGSKITAVVRTSKKGTYRMSFSPALGLGTKIRSVSLNGNDHPYEIDKHPLSQAVQPRLDFQLSGRDTIELFYEPAPEIIPPDNQAKTGDLSRGLRIVKMDWEGSEIVISMEGLAGRKYTLGIASGNRIASVSGAEFSEKGLMFKIARGAPGEYLSHEIRIRLK